MKTSKRMQLVDQKLQEILKVNKSTFFDITTAIEKIKSIGSAKFNESIDFAIKIDIDYKKFGHMFRTMVAMPHGLGKKIRIISICPFDQIENAKSYGADFSVSVEDFVEQIKNAGNTKLWFDICIAHTSTIMQLNKLAKILGPQGLMPSVKAGTVTDNLELAIKTARLGQTEIRMSDGGVIHTSIGRINFTTQELYGNSVAVLQAIKRCKPNNKEVVFKNAFMSSTMGRSLAIDLQSIQQIHI